MTNDELLAGFLDRSLNEDQLIEFEARKHAEPAFAQQVKEMLAVEKLLVGSVPIVSAPTDFLSSVEHTVAAKVAAGSSSGGLFSAFTSNVWALITGAAVIATTSYFVVKNVTQNSIPSVTPRVPTQVAPRSIPKQDVPAQVAPTQVVPRIIAPQGIPTQRVQERASQGITQRVPPSEVDASRVDMLTSNPDRALDGLLRDFEKCRAAGDHVLCSQIALAIGRTYSQQHSSEQAEQYLNLALLEAKKARLVQFEIEANGELGLIAQSNGRISEAKQFYKIAIDLGIANGIQVEKWSKALEVLGN